MPVTSTPVTSDTTNRYRLPTSVTPAHYDIELDVDLAGHRFTGSVGVDVTVTETIDALVLNAAELEIDEAWLQVGDRRVAARVELDEETERATLALDEPVAAGAARVELRFRGELNDKLRGFYRTTYTDPEGVTQTAASTQFEATHARRAFPCWDEPALKATFAVTLVVPAGQLAISNASEIDRRDGADGRTTFRFATTMVMSTYLVAFVVGPFEATPPIDVRGVPLRIVHPRGQGHLVDFALETGRFGLEYFADYYGIAYPGDKLDMVAVPDFAFGAMENLGCITFREVLLLIDPATTTQPEMQRVADVVFHELAHMWFGDLVTMRWWNGLWLNEAFATFMEMKCTDAFRPPWARWVDFGLSRSGAFDTDSLAATRPIEFEVISPDDAEGMFDILTYDKGAAVLRMIEQYLGEEAFRAGVRKYLVEHSYGNTETTDLWDAIEAETGQPVRAVADSWIFQGGYPLVKLAQRSATTIELSQQRFRYDGGSTDARWHVPLLVDTTAGDVTTRHRVLLGDEPVVLDAGGEIVSALGNAGGHGFYRMTYDDELRAALVARAQDHLQPIERYALVDDAFAAMQAGQLGALDFLGMVRGLVDDDDLSVWQRMRAGLTALSRLLDGDDLARYQALVRDLAGPALDIAGWEPAAGESDRQRELRALLLGLVAVTGNDAKAQERAIAMHGRLVAQPGSVDPSLGAAAATVVATRGGSEDYELFLQLSESAPTPQGRRRYLYALADFRDPALVERTARRCLSAEVRTQDAPYLLGQLLGNRYAARATWAFVVENWDAINDAFPSNTIVRMLSTVPTFTDADLAAEVRAFFDSHPVPQAAKTLAQILEKLAVNVALGERERPRLVAALAQGGSV